MLNREQILGTTPERQVVEVPELGGQILIQAISAGAAQVIQREHDLVDFVIASAINDDGSFLFSIEDREALRRLPFAAINRIARAAISLNGLSAAEVETLAKNSEPGLNGASSSA
jgi:hypothetical protein